MHIKFTKHGAGKASKAVRYLLGTHDHLGIERAEVAVLRGDPSQFVAVADALDFSRRYTSSVIAFAPTDRPTAGQIEAALDGFASVAFAGIDADRVAWTAVKHAEKNGAVHIHILTARVDLATGKSLNIAPPGWQKSYDPLRDAMNYENGWARPDDPARARLVQPQHRAFINAAELRAGLSATKDPKAVITEYLLNGIEAGLINNRKDIISALKDAGFEIHRSGKDYISIRANADETSIRLKGVLYGIEFNADAYRKTSIENGGEPSANREINEERANESRRELEIAINRRAVYNSRRYQIRPCHGVIESTKRYSKPNIDKDPSYVTGIGRDNREIVEIKPIEYNDRQPERTVNPKNRRADAKFGEELKNSERKNSATESSVDESDRKPEQHTAASANRTDKNDAVALQNPNVNSSDFLHIDYHNDLDFLPDTDFRKGQQRNTIESEITRNELSILQITRWTDVRSQTVLPRDIEENENTIPHEHIRQPNFSPFARAVGAGTDAFPRIYKAWRDDEQNHPGLRVSSKIGPERMPNLCEFCTRPGLEKPSNTLLQIAISRSGNFNSELQSILESLKNYYERNRNSISESINGIIESISIGREQLIAASANIEQSSRVINESTGQSDAANKRLVECVNKTDDALRDNVSGFNKIIKRVSGVIKMNRDDELERFKININLVEFAQSKGYEIDVKESSRSSVVMHFCDDKIIVATDIDGHGVYFSVRDDHDNGSIVDFVQKRQGLNLGQVRKELRPWTSTVTPSQTTTPRRKPEPSTADRQRVLSSFIRTQPIKGEHVYLQKEREIDAKTLNEPRFLTQIRVDSRNNAIFPHFDRQGLCGYELKNQGFTGFAKGGEKGLWYSSNLSSAQKIVIVESAIDALSHAQLDGQKGRDSAYVSVGGALSDKQRSLLAGLLEKANERGAIVVVLAMDKDAAGQALAEKIRQLAPEGLKIERQEPVYGKDWNEQLVHEADQSNDFGMGM
jgi:Toprim-like/Protein of unknown function (DUF3991)/Relaxase/Mobilisation nuclease domain